MFTKRDYDKISFAGVGIAMILFGAAILAIAIAAWALQCSGLISIVAYPFFKIIGGLMVLGTGYVILELELLRKK